MMVKFIFILLCLIPVAWSTHVNANYFTTKLFLLSFVSGLCFLFAVFQKNKTFDIPTRHWKWLASFFIAIHILYAVIFDFPMGLYDLPKFLSLVGIILFLSFNKFDLEIFFKKYEWFVAGFFGILFILTSRGFVDQIGSGIPYQSGELIQPLGNVNMVAEFYLLCLPFVFYWISQKNEMIKSVKIIIFILLNFILLATKSRSAYLGLGLWWVFWLYQYFFYRYAKVFVLVVILGTIGAFYKIDFSGSLGKSYSTQERVNFYYSAWDLIKDRPLGVASQYANQIVPYRLVYPVGPNEGEYPDQPHSEILKWGVEFGWLGLVMALLCIALMTKDIAIQGSFLLKGAGLVILPQLLFQFPFENPASILMLALYLYLFARSLPQEEVKWTKELKIFSAVAGLGLIYYAAIFLGSVYIESNYPNDVEKTALACKWNPSYLRGCVRKNHNLFRTRQYLELKKNLKEDMRYNYYAADYLKVLSDLVSEGNLEPDLVMQDESLTSISVYDSVANQTQITKKNCQILHVYVFMYKDQQHYSDDDRMSCIDTAAPFGLLAKPHEFDREYKAWLETILK